MASLETNKSDSHLSEKQDFLHAESFGFSLVEFREKNGDDLRILFDMQNPEYMEERAGIDAVRSHEKMFHTLVMNEKMYMTDGSNATLLVKIIDVLKKIEDDGMLNIQFAQSSGCRSLFAHIARIKNSANSTYYKHILDQLDKKILHLL